MIEIGRIQALQIKRKKDFGIYVGDETEDVLLPQKEVDAAWEIGDTVSVFVYRDSKDRKIATCRKPYLTVGEIGLLQVVSVGSIGAFLNNGLERDVLLPFKEQTTKVEEGKEYAVYLYVDKSDRLCATMKLYRHIEPTEAYRENDEFEGVVYEYKDSLGAFVWLTKTAGGLIPKSEIFQRIEVGEKVQGRVVRIREDGKIELSTRMKAYRQMEQDEADIYRWMEEHGGEIPFTDKADPEKIKATFGLSKNAFKRAIGGLLKAGKITIEDTTIRIK